MRIFERKKFKKSLKGVVLFDDLGTFGRNFLEQENNCSYKDLIRFFFFSNVRAAKYFSII
jgi:hypothetical protein